jgi:hypothetical protein
MEGKTLAPADQVSVVVFSEDDWEQISREMDMFGRASFLVDLRRPPVKQAPRLTAIVRSDRLIALALSRSRGRSGSLHTQVLFLHVDQVAPAIPADEIVGRFSTHVRSTAGEVLKSGGVLTERASAELELALEQINPTAGAVLRRLRELRRRPRRSSSSLGELLNEQRDAIALGLEAAGLDSDTLLPDVDDDPAPVPFLTGLALAPTSEASVIRHDQRQFGDWALTEGRVHDVVRFTDPRDSRRRVTVVYADKEDLEFVTGTDLIYYREDNPTYVLVQYKRMRRNPSAKPSRAWEYRPDAQLATELDRMRKLRSTAEPRTVDDWRLSAEPFYFKLIEDNKLRPEGNRLVRGMYFPFDLFELMLADPRSLGSGGGKCIGWHNAPRYFTNTDFLALLQNCFIGSAGVTTDDLSAVINQVLLGGRGAVVVRDETEADVDRRRHA